MLSPKVGVGSYAWPGGHGGLQGKICLLAGPRHQDKICWNTHEISTRQGVDSDSQKDLYFSFMYATYWLCVTTSPSLLP